MKHGAIWIAVLFSALIVASSVSSMPQHGAGILTGVVLGPDDKPVAHAAVTYQSSAGDSPHALHTDAHGRFTITKLRSDNYELRASAKGVFSEWQKNVTVRSGQTKSVTLRLEYAKEMPKAYGATPASSQKKQ
jgi:hypothetical protein